jgi:D-glycero-D-manno-heptose 1,7-bisphosphate phosphatase
LKRAVFLDRDGVLAEAIVRNNRAVAPTRLEDFVLVSDAGEQVARLRAAGLVCLVFTNQPEIARGLLDPAVLDVMHERLRAAVSVDEIYVCPHDPTDDCACHKPKIGMLLDAAERYQLDLARSFVVGDRWRDVDAGRAAGCYSILIERPYSACPIADACAADLVEAVDLVLAHLGEA